MNATDTTHTLTPTPTPNRQESTAPRSTVTRGSLWRHTPLSWSALPLRLSSSPRTWTASSPKLRLWQHATPNCSAGLYPWTCCGKAWTNPTDSGPEAHRYDSRTGKAAGNSCSQLCLFPLRPKSIGFPEVLPKTSFVLLYTHIGFIHKMARDNPGQPRAHFGRPTGSRNDFPRRTLALGG